MQMDSFWDFLWLLFWSYIFVAYLILLFHIFGDLFRDRDLGGFAKALWTIGLIFFPFLMVLIYLIARGKGMAERQAGAMRQAQAETDQYIKSVAGTTSGRGPDRLGEGVARQRQHQPGRVRATEGESARLRAAAFHGAGRNSNRTSTKGTTVSTSLDETGPIDYLVVEFPGNRMTGEGFPLLVDLVDRGIIRILDFGFVTRDTDGSVTAVEIADFDGDGSLDLAVFQGASSGLLGPDDLEEAASVIEPGSSAGILVYENVWAAPFAVALRRGGAQLVASGRIPVQAILAALDAAEASQY